MTNLELCEQVLGSMLQKVIADQEEKGIRASGASARSLEVVMNDAGGDITGFKYIGAQIEGRRPGKFPPIDDIISWIQHKGLQFDIAIESLAFLIARKIARFGTNIFSGDAPALFLKGIVQEGTAELAKGIAKNSVEEILDVFRILKPA